MPKTLEQIEYGEFAKTLLWSMIKNPLMKREQRTTILNEAINQLSPSTLNRNIDKVLDQVNMSKKECVKYASTGQQLGSIVRRLPRLANYNERLRTRIKKARRKHRLIR